LGVVVGDGLLDLNAATGGRLPSTMLEFLQRSEELMPAARLAVSEAKASALHALQDVRLLAALPNPPALRDFFAFEDHAKAAALRRHEALPKQWYDVPAYFKGNHREIYGPEDEIPWPWYTRRLDFECEVACVVGRKGRDLSPEEAASCIFGYMIFNDFSARDIQKKELANLMGPGKGKDFANAFGPFLASADEADPRRDFAMKVRVNGEQWAEGHFKDQYWGFPLLLSHISQCETVYPGDVLGSGAFHKGCGLDLDRWIRPGDVVELEVPILGVLRNRIGAPKEQRELNYRKA
jgi:2-keto-4-pentenoate hydratase/2-oxohepta-3-ene-1,7-dioic acid hydratase in catechol pathway